jgi:DNA-binding MarR family transcriptional regulator
LSTEVDSSAHRAELMPCMDCACFNLRKATRATTQYYDEMLRPVGIRVTQFSLLVAVSIAGSVTVTRLAELSVMDRTTLTRNLEVLEKQRLIEVTPGEDRRTRMVSITLEGRKTLIKALPLWKTAQAQVVEALGKLRWQSLQENLSRIVTMKELR